MKELANKINEPRRMKPMEPEKQELKGIIGVTVLMQISWKFYFCQTIYMDWNEKDVYRNHGHFSFLYF